MHTYRPPCAVGRGSTSLNPSARLNFGPARTHARAIRVVAVVAISICVVSSAIAIGWVAQLSRTVAFGSPVLQDVAEKVQILAHE